MKNPWKYGDIRKKVSGLFNTVLSDRIPEEWRSVLIMIFKNKGDG